jgi:hypothetical protein
LARDSGHRGVILPQPPVMRRRSFTLSPARRTWSLATRRPLTMTIVDRGSTSRTANIALTFWPAGTVKRSFPPRRRLSLPTGMTSTFSTALPPSVVTISAAIQQTTLVPGKARSVPSSLPALDANLQPWARPNRVVAVPTRTHRLRHRGCKPSHRCQHDRPGKSIHNPAQDHDGLITRGQEL